MSLTLSICIPTYNRSEYLNSQLEKLFFQISENKLFGDVEVIVSNNASHDDTSEIIKKYLDAGLVYHEQTENIGPDANFFTLFNMAKGKYVWLLGDDDDFTGDVIPFIINSLNNKNIDYLYLKPNGEVLKDITRTGELLSNRDYFKRVLLNTTFMSSHVIRNTLIQANLEEAERNFGDLMAYYYLFLKCLEDSETCMISGSREIFMEADNTGGYKFYQVWGRGVLDVLEKTKFGKEPKLFNLFRNELLFCLILPFTCGFRKGSLKSDLDNESALEFMSKHFGTGWRALVFSYYHHSPIIVLKMYNLILRGVNKYRHFVNRTI